MFLQRGKSKKNTTAAKTLNLAILAPPHNPIQRRWCETGRLCDLQLSINLRRWHGRYLHVDVEDILDLRHLWNETAPDLPRENSTQTGFSYFYVLVNLTFSGSGVWRKATRCWKRTETNTRGKNGIWIGGAQKGLRTVCVRHLSPTFLLHHHPDSETSTNLSGLTSLFCLKVFNFRKNRRKNE